jgi:hypothetical protein
MKLRFYFYIIITAFINNSFASSTINFTTNDDTKIKHLNALDDEIDTLQYKNIFHDDVISETTPHDFVIVSLGTHCGVAWWIRIFNIRSFALPFDWCITPYNALYSIIADDFQHYFKEENLVTSQNMYWSNYLKDFYQRIYHSEVDGSIGAVLDKHYQMLFTHDFPNHHPHTIANQYQTHYEKYKRRINRFFKIMHSEQHVYLIRLHDITKEETLALHSLLKSKFPTTSFTLIALGSNAEEFIEDWNIHGIKNRYISDHTSNTPALAEAFWKEFVTDLLADKLK